MQPASAGKVKWRAVQNESQMLLFNHPVNDARQQSGKPVISGVWFWGGGTLAEANKPKYGFVAADAALPRALARQSVIKTAALDWANIVNAQGDVLAVVTSPADALDTVDLERWAIELAKLDRDFFAPVSAALASGQISSLNIYVPNDERTTVYHLRPHDLRFRFWRATKSLINHA